MPIKPISKRRSWTVGVPQVTQEKADREGAPDDKKHLLQTMLKHSFL